MKKTIGWLVLVVVAAVVLSIFYYAKEQAPVPPPPQVVEAPAPPAPAAEPEIRYPIGADAEERALPSLIASDSAIKQALSDLWGERALVEFFQLDGFIRRVVATIDNLPREKVALRLMPVKPVPGQFRTAAAGESLTISPDNAVRYAAYVKFATSIDTRKLVAVYTRFYPLFQQAYQDLGYPKAYFNDRLVEVIDHVLDAPELPPQAKLARPKIVYVYADPELESRSAGQKILMRIGNDNAARVKAKLREIRAELTRNELAH